MNKLNQILEEKIKRAQESYETALEMAQTHSGRMTLTPLAHPRVQHAHGVLNALADLRTELMGEGLLNGDR